jgi:hypothetical protein
VTQLKTRRPDPSSVAESFMAWALGVVLALYGVRILVSGRYVARSGEVVEDPVRVWLSGSLTVAAGVFLVTVFFRSWRGDKGPTGS